MFLPKVVYVEVAGTCNLSCPSCPVGNIGQAGRPKNLIDVKLYEQIVEKLKREYSEDLDTSFVCKSDISIKIRNFGTTFETYLISV